MSILSVAKTVGKVGGSAVVELMKIGTWGALNLYTQNQFRNTGTAFIRDVEKGAGHAAYKLRVIKSDND